MSTSQLPSSKWDLDVSIFKNNIEENRRTILIKCVHEHFKRNNVRSYQEFINFMYERQKIFAIPVVRNAETSFNRYDSAVINFDTVVYVDTSSKILWLCYLPLKEKSGICWVENCYNVGKSCPRYTCFEHDQEESKELLGLQYGSQMQLLTSMELKQKYLSEIYPKIGVVHERVMEKIVAAAFCQKIQNLTGLFEKRTRNTGMDDTDNIGILASPVVTRVLQVKLFEKIFSFGGIDLWFNPFHNRFFFKQSSKTEWSLICRHQKLTKKDCMAAREALTADKENVGHSNEGGYYTCLRPVVEGKDFCISHSGLFKGWKDVIFADILRECNVQMWSMMNEKQLLRYIRYLQKRGPHHFGSLNGISVMLDEEFQIAIQKGGQKYHLCENFDVNCRSIYEVPGTCPVCTPQVYDYGVAAYRIKNIDSEEKYVVVKGKRAVGLAIDIKTILDTKANSFVTRGKIYSKKLVHFKDGIPTRAEAESYQLALLMLIRYEQDIFNERYDILNIQVSFGNSPWRTFAKVLREIGFRLEIIENEHRSTRDTPRFQIEERNTSPGYDAHVIYRCINPVTNMHYIGKTVSYKDRKNIVSLGHNNKMKDRTGLARIQDNGGTQNQIIGKTADFRHNVTESIFILAFLFAEEYNFEWDMRLSNQQISEVRLHTWPRQVFFQDISHVCKWFCNTGLNIEKPDTFNVTECITKKFRKCPK